MRSISAFAPDSSGGQDIRLDGTGNLQIVTEDEEVRQRVIEHLRWHLGQWFLAVLRGVPYESRIFTGSTTAGLAASVVTEEIRSVDGVADVFNVEAEIDFTTRRMTYKASVLTDMGALMEVTEPIG